MAYCYVSSVNTLETSSEECIFSANCTTRSVFGPLSENALAACGWGGGYELARRLALCGHHMVWSRLIAT